MCISISTITKDGTVLDGRTQELTARYLSEFVYMPRNYQYPAVRSFETGHYANTKYAIFGQNAIGLVAERDMIVDGYNEHGLSGQTLFFAQNANYPSLDKDKYQEGQIEYVNILNFILGNFKNCNEIREYFKKTNCMYAYNSFERDPGHYSFVDQSGDNLVIEPEEGQFKIKENPNRVLTNSPNLEYHYDNLKHYTGLSNIDTIKSKVFVDQNNQAVTHAWMGNQALGLPGDFSSTSRFVRASFMLHTMEQATDAMQGVNQVFRVLHTSDVVEGVIKRNNGGYFPSTQVEPLLDEDKLSMYCTDHIIVKDLTNLRTYYKTYDNLSIRMIDFSKFDLNNQQIRYLKMSEDRALKVQEITF